MSVEFTSGIHQTTAHWAAYCLIWTYSHVVSFFARMKTDVTSVFADDEFAVNRYSTTQSDASWAMFVARRCNVLYNRASIMFCKKIVEYAKIEFWLMSALVTCQKVNTCIFLYFYLKKDNVNVNFPIFLGPRPAIRRVPYSNHSVRPSFCPSFCLSVKKL